MQRFEPFVRLKSFSFTLLGTGRETVDQQGEQILNSQRPRHFLILRYFNLISLNSNHFNYFELERFATQLIRVNRI